MPNSKKNSLTWSQKTSILVVRGYQRARPAIDQVVLSVFGHVSSCKHTPTCSEYTVDQIKAHGTIAGIRLGVARILSCR